MLQKCVVVLCHLLLATMGSSILDPRRIKLCLFIASVSVDSKLCFITTNANHVNLGQKVQLMGNCVSCSVNQMTLKNGVEMTIKKHAPQIQEVISVE